MLTKIIDKLKTGRITNVVLFGMEQGLNPPYIVVKPEKDALGRGRGIWVIVHMLPGQQIFLDDYVRNDVENLLDNFKSLSRHNNYNMLLTEKEYTDIVVSNDDKTISMGRLFLMPSMTF